MPSTILLDCKSGRLRLTTNHQAADSATDNTWALEGENDLESILLIPQTAVQTLIECLELSETSQTAWIQLDSADPLSLQALFKAARQHSTVSFATGQASFNMTLLKLQSA